MCFSHTAKGNKVSESNYLRDLTNRFMYLQISSKYFDLLRYLYKMKPGSKIVAYPAIFSSKRKNLEKLRF